MEKDVVGRGRHHRPGVPVRSVVPRAVWDWYLAGRLNPDPTCRNAPPPRPLQVLPVIMSCLLTYRLEVHLWQHSLLPRGWDCCHHAGKPNPVLTEQPVTPRVANPLGLSDARHQIACNPSTTILVLP